MNELYPEIRWVKDIRKIHVQGYIYSNLDKWSTRSRINNKDFFTKLMVMVEQVYHIKLDFEGIDYGLSAPKTSIKTHPMQTDDFILLSNESFKSSSKASLVPLLIASIGCRIEELSSIKPDEIDLEGHRVYLTNCKNGRNRDLYIRDEFFFLWKFVKERAEKLDYPTILGGIKYESCQNFIGKLKRKLNMTNYPYEGCHAIRKMYARRRFSEELLKGKSVDESWSKVQRELGHGKRCREDLFKTYIGVGINKFKEYYSKTNEPVISEEEVQRQIEHIRSFENQLETKFNKK